MMKMMDTQKLRRGTGREARGVLTVLAMTSLFAAIVDFAAGVPAADATVHGLISVGYVALAIWTWRNPRWWEA